MTHLFKWITIFHLLNLGGGNIRRQILLAVSIFIMVFAVFSVAVTAEQSQNQAKDQQRSQISNNINSVQKSLVQQLSTTTSTNGKASTNATNQSSNPVVNKTNSTSTGPVVVISNQTSNQTTNNQTNGPIVNNTTIPGNITYPTDINAALRNAFNQLLAPVISDTELVRANPTQQSINRLLNDVESVLDKIGDLNIRINVNI